MPNSDQSFIDPKFAEWSDSDPQHCLKGADYAFYSRHIDILLHDVRYVLPRIMRGICIISHYRQICKVESL